MTFTPTDTANYNTAYGSVSVTVVESLPPDAWFRVGDGPEWYTLPPCYSAREAAALLFGGTLSQYAVSTDPYNINHMAWVDGRGDTTYLNTPASEDFKGGVLYDDSGSYSAYVGDHLDLSLSKTNYVWFSVAPVIIGPPQSEVGQIGGSASLQVAAIGADELSFQWYFNETNLVADGTNSVLLLTDVNPDQLGSYVVVVSNAYGSVTSAPTSLAVVGLPLTCGSNRTVEVGTAWDFDTPTVTGGTATVTVLLTVTNAGCGNGFSATRTWGASDAYGNSATCSQTITVVEQPTCNLLRSR